MTAMETVQKMLDQYEMKTGKAPTEIKLGPGLYDSLRRELKAQIPNDVEIDYIKIKGVLIERLVTH